MAQKISHFQNRLTEIKVPESRILPGMVVSFQYGSPTANDKRPLMLVLYFDRKASRLEGINLNYLKESDIQLFYKECKRIGVDTDWEDILGGSKEYIRIMMNTKFSPSRYDGKVVYKMLFHRNRRYKRAYRQYTLNKVTSLKVVSYLVDVLRRSDAEFTDGDIWRIQSTEDSKGYVWRAKNQDGEAKSFPSTDDEAAARWAVSGKGPEDET